MTFIDFLDLSQKAYSFIVQCNLSSKRARAIENADLIVFFRLFPIFFVAFVYIFFSFCYRFVLTI